MRAIAAIAYFLKWGLAYGFLFGAWSTTMMFPILGTMFGIFWGTGIGVVCGVLCGILVAIIQALTFHPDVDLLRYRRRLSLLIGLFVGVIAPLLLLVSSEGTLWGDGYMVLGNPSYFNVSIIAVTFWGSLSAAYAAHAHPLNEARFMLKQAEPPEEQWDIGLVIWAILQNPFLWVITLLIDVIIAPIVFSAHDTFLMILAGTCLVALMLLLVAFGTAAFMMFLKRLMSSEHTMITASHIERLILTGSAAVFTGVICLWPLSIFPFFRPDTTVIVIGLSALGMGTAVYQAFPLYGKDKRKAITADLEEKRAS